MRKKKPYYDKPGVSNSSLAWLLPESGGSPAAYSYFLNNPPPELDSPEVTLGSLIHAFCEDPAGTSTIVISALPGPGVVKTIKYLLAQEETPLDKFDKEQIYQAAKAVNYGQSWKPDTVVRKVLEEGFEYASALLRENDHLYIVDPEQDKVFKILADRLRDEVWFSHTSTFFETPTHVEREKEIYFELEGVQCKALIDRLVTMNGPKQILVEDIKTTHMPISWFEGYNDGITEEVGQMFKRQVHRQLAFYDHAVRKSLGKEAFDWRIDHIIVAIQTTPPYEIKRIVVPVNLIDVGRKRITVALDQIKRYDKELI